MTIKHQQDQGLQFSNVPSDYFQFLQQIPIHADASECIAGEERLRQSPIGDPTDDSEDEINSDWREHVLPDLLTEFTHQLDTVTADLNTATKFDDRGGDTEYEFLLPIDHLDLWYGAINQARLVMQERYQFPHIDTPEAMEAMMNSEHFGPYLTSRFYTEIQGILLSIMMPD